MDTCTLYGPAVSPAQVKAPKSRVALPSDGPPEAGKEPINSRILDAYKEKIVEFSPGDPSIIHAVAVASHVMPALVYRVLVIAGKIAPLTSCAETVTKAVPEVKESPPRTVPTPDPRPFVPERLVCLARGVLSWARSAHKLVKFPAWVEDALKQHTLDPYPEPIPATNTLDDWEDTSWMM